MKRVRWLLALVFVIALAAFLLFVWPTIYRYDRVGMFEVRTNRLTSTLALRTPGGWTTPPEPRSVRESPSAQELRAATLKQFSWGSNGLMIGQVVNTGTEPVRGKIAVHIEVYAKNGTRLKDRTLRLSVDWPPGQESLFLLRTNLTTPQPDDETKVRVVSIFSNG